MGDRHNQPASWPTSPQWPSEPQWAPESRSAEPRSAAEPPRAGEPRWAAEPQWAPEPRSAGEQRWAPEPQWAGEPPWASEPQWDAEPHWGAAPQWGAEPGQLPDPARATLPPIGGLPVLDDDPSATSPIGFGYLDEPEGSPAGGPRHRRHGDDYPTAAAHSAPARGLPGWVGPVLALLAIGLVLWLRPRLLPWVLICCGVVGAGIGVVGLLRGPLPRVKIGSRPAAAVALLLGLVGIGIGSALAAPIPKPASSPKVTKPPVAAVPTTVPPLVPTGDLPLGSTEPTPAPTPSATTTPSTTPPPSPTASRSSPSPTPKPLPLCGAPANPFGYNFCGRGGAVSSPPSSVCNYFDCVSNFWDGSGYLEECRDHRFSLTGGQPNACAGHGGTRRTVSSGP